MSIIYLRTDTNSCIISPWILQKIFDKVPYMT